MSSLSIIPCFNVFKNRLLLLNEFLDNKKRYDMYDKPRNCLLCDAKNVSTKVYKYNNVSRETLFIN